MTPRSLLPLYKTPTDKLSVLYWVAIIISIATLTPGRFSPSTPGSDNDHVIGFGGWALMCVFGPIENAFVSWEKILFIIFWGSK